MALENCLTIIINGTTFTGYSFFDVINSTTYVTSPERTNTGSMPGISNIETFVVTTIEITYNLMAYDKYKTFIASTIPVEFAVTYYDPDIEEEKTGMFYVAPRTKKEIMWKNRAIEGIKNFTIELISTNNEV